MEAYFATIFEYIRHERSLILLLLLTVPDILKQPIFTDHEISITKDLALQKPTQTTNFKKTSGYCFP